MACVHISSERRGEADNADNWQLPGHCQLYTVYDCLAANARLCIIQYRDMKRHDISIRAFGYDMNTGQLECIGYER